jgi:hypothetical protein
MKPYKLQIVNVRKFENGEHLQREAKRNDGNLESIHK